MDLLIDIDQVEPAMTLSRPVKKNGQFLLPSGRELKRSDIQKLREWDVHQVYVRSAPTEKIA